MGRKGIFILGGYGETGRRLARHFLERTEKPVLIGGRNGGKAKRLADQLNDQYKGKRVRNLEVEANDRRAVRLALKEADFFIQAGPALPVDTVRSLAEAVMDAGADWMDMQVDPKQAATLEELEQRIKAEGRCFATQGGFHPGLPAALIRWAAGRMDSIETAHVSGFVNPEQGLILTSGVDELIDLFRDYSAEIYSNGEWVRIGSSLKDMRRFEFGFGIGSQITSPITLDEMRSLPDLFPDLRHTGFYVGGFDTVTNMVTMPMLMMGLKILPWVKPQTWGRFLCWSHRTFNSPPYGTCIHMDANGIKSGERVNIVLDIYHEEEYELTAVPIVSAVQQIMDGTARRPGLWRMGVLVDPERLLSDIREMGMHIEEKIGQ